MLYPDTVEVLAAYVKSTLCCMAAAPDPVKDSRTVEFDALLATVILAGAAPLDCGVNVTVKSMLLPDAIVAGSEMPLITCSEVLGVIEEAVTLPPVALKLPVRGLFVPTVMLPKLRVAGVTANWPGGVVPVPESDNVRFATGASEVISKLPLLLP